MTEQTYSPQYEREAALVVCIEHIWSVAALLNCPPSDLVQELVRAVSEIEGTTRRITRELASDCPAADLESTE